MIQAANIIGTGLATTGLIGADIGVGLGGYLIIGVLILIHYFRSYFNCSNNSHSTWA